MSEAICGVTCGEAAPDVASLIRATALPIRAAASPSLSTRGSFVDGLDQSFGFFRILDRELIGTAAALLFLILVRLIKSSAISFRRCVAAQ